MTILALMPKWSKPYAAWPAGRQKRQKIQLLGEKNMTNELTINQLHHQTFESMRKTDKRENEYWLSRDLCEVLDYSEYRRFESVIERAKEACKNSGHSTKDHFRNVTEEASVGSGATRKISNIRLSRYACYLVVQNGDPSKPVIANGQTYFAIQARRQELQDANFAQLDENERRIALRNEITEHNKRLSSTAKGAGVDTPLDYAIFQDHGYKGLYGGLTNKDIQTNKGLNKSEKILDHMGSAELAANYFRVTQTEEKLRRENIKGKTSANQTHYNVGAKVRSTIEEIGGTMPEALPTPKMSMKQLEKL